MISLFNVLTALAALGAVSAAPTPTPVKRSSQLSCVTYQFNGPFAASGADGFVHLFVNSTSYDSSTETTSFNETRLGLVDGTIQPCGDCRTTEQFGFEVCQGPDKEGYYGLANSFYGHLLYRNVGSPRCVVADHTGDTLDGVALVVRDCEYDYDAVPTNAQYWQMSVTDGQFAARLQYKSTNDTSYYGTTWTPSEDGKTLQGENAKTFTYYCFKSPF